MASASASSAASAVALPAAFASSGSLSFEELILDPVGVSPAFVVYCIVHVEYIILYDLVYIFINTVRIILSIASVLLIFTLVRHQSNLTLLMHSAHQMIHSSAVFCLHSIHL